MAIAEGKEKGIIIVSIPKRVSEVLWHSQSRHMINVADMFQSLKGFQRFCG